MNNSKRTSRVAIGTFLAFMYGGSALASGNPQKGQDLFAEECGDCHSVAPGKNKKGPTLHGVLGRKSGSVADFSGYSDAIKQAGLVWTTDKIDAYITQPKKIVPAGKMKYDGLEDTASRADIISYLQTIK